MEKCKTARRTKRLQSLLAAFAIALVQCQITGTFSAAAGGGGTLQDLDAQEILNGKNHIE
jgi:hypothetical protein